MAVQFVLRKVMLLRELAGNPKMTQRELAERTGIRPGTIGAMYHGRIKRVELEQLDRLCEVLGCKPGELFERE